MGSRFQPDEGEWSGRGIAARLALGADEVDYHLSLPSTQVRAREAERPLRLVICRHQTAGLGQHGRSWLSSAVGRESLTFTAIIRAGLPADVAGLVPLAAGVAVAEAVENLTGLRLGIKWPNDLEADGAKVAGILAEGRSREGVLDRVLIGIGVNVTGAPPAQLVNPAASIGELAGAPVAPLALLAEIWDRLHERMGELSRDSEEIIRAWTGRSATIGRRVRVGDATTRLEGIATGIDPSGGLQITPAAGPSVRILTGTVRHLD